MFNIKFKIQENYCLLNLIVFFKNDSIDSIASLILVWLLLSLLSVSDFDTARIQFNVFL